jgi:asparagine synthetase B (glutamine-hydrolysing)
VAEVTSARLVVLAAVLHVRGATVCEQPVVDSASGNVLAWNGELYDGDDGDAGSDDGEEADTARLSALLNGAGAADDLVARIASLRGPWALVFWHEASRTLWWGRDRTGRRSLLVRFAGSDSGDGERAVHTGVMLSSVAGAAPRAAEHDAGAAAFWSPVRPDGLYCARRLDGGGYTVALHPWRPVTPRVPRGVTTRAAAADELHRLLRHALRLRVRSRSSALRARSDAAVSSSDDAAAAAAAAPLGVLFSGGLDSMVVAALASEALARDGAPRSPIELINVCFDHPRHASPDRLASIAGVLELSRRHPARVWRLVLVDATFDDVTSVGENGAMQRAELARLIAPRTTHMDLNIGTALWYAARGAGDAVEIGGGGGADVDVDSDLDAMVAEMLRVARARPTPKAATFAPRRSACTIEGCKRIAKSSCPRVMCKLCCKRAFRADLDAPPCAAHGPQRRYVPGGGGERVGSCGGAPPAAPAAAPAAATLSVAELAARVLDAVGTRTRGYRSCARVLLHGAGADEQMAGYARHRTMFGRVGAEALRAALAREVSELWTRNLGRDDRCIADHGREVRHPFLDRDVTAFLAALPLSLIADFALERGVGDKLILRDVARMLRLELCATLPKRAIQFGSRIAKAANKHIGASRSSRSVGAATVAW